MPRRLSFSSLAPSSAMPAPSTTHSNSYRSTGTQTNSHPHPQSMALPVRRKLVVIGDGACGKTSLLISFSEGRFPTTYVPTVFENYVSDIYVDNTPVELALWDTAGQEDYDRLRPLSYPDTDVLLICFAIDNPDSLENAREKWIAEALHYCGDKIPIMLVGCKADLRTPEALARGLPMVMREDGMNMVKEIDELGAYAECSAMDGFGVHEVFQIATRAALVTKHPRSHRKCFVL
ncbi:Rho1 GTPase [Mycena kentingensis (nom. inval.)]|nr:Rho1 GTPase [Mycena kentingensis (nom. inval.)]